MSISNAPALELLESGGELERVFVHSQTEILGTLYHLLGNWDLARDCLHKTFHRCWDGRHEPRPVAHIKPWVFGTALHLGREAQPLAEERRQQSVESAEIAYDLDAGTMATELPQAMQVMHDSMGTLDTPAREVFLLSQNGGLSYEQIAEIVRRPISDVRRLMQTALAHFRRQGSSQRVKE